MTVKRMLTDDAARWLAAREGISDAQVRALLRRVREGAPYDTPSYSIDFSRAGGHWGNGRFELLIDEEN